MAHLFISYSTKDAGFAEILERELEANDYSVWRDKSEIRGGDQWVEAIKEALSQAWTVVVLQSPDSEKSEWVGEELQYADNRNIPVIPILLRGDPWFGFLRKQYIDIRSLPESQVPDALYVALLKHAPPVPLEDEIGKSLVEANSASRMAMIPNLESIAWNSKSPRGMAARRILERLARDPDAYVRKTAQTALKRLGIPRTDKGSSGLLRSLRAASANAANATTNLADSPSPVNRLLLIVVAVAVVIIAGVVIALSGRANTNNNASLPTSQIGASLPTVKPSNPTEITDPTATAEELTSVETPQNTETPTAAPNPNAASVTYRADFNTNELDSSWHVGQNVNVGNGSVVMVGEGGYNNFIERKGFEDNTGLLISFEVTEGDYYIQFVSGDLNSEGNPTPNYRALLISPSSKTEWMVQAATGPNFDTHYTFELLPHHKYHALIGVGNGGHVYYQIWTDNVTDHFLVSEAFRVDESWAGRTWYINLTARDGILKINDYAELHFPDDYELASTPPANVE